MGGGGVAGEAVPAGGVEGGRGGGGGGGGAPPGQGVQVRERDADVEVRALGDADAADDEVAGRGALGHVG